MQRTSLSVHAARPLATVLVIVLMLAAPLMPPGAEAFFGPRGAVVIEGDDMLRLPPQVSGVGRGSGTADDPFVIERGFFHVAPGLRDARLSAITIRDTTAHVLIRDNVFAGVRGGSAHSSTADGVGILLVNATNVRVEKNHFDLASIRAIDSGIISVHGNYLRNSQGDAIDVNADVIEIHGNRIWIGAGRAILLHGKEIRVWDNMVDAATGIEFDRMFERGTASIEKNEIRAHTGVWSWADVDLHLSRNLIRASQFGVYAFGGTLEMEDNVVLGSKLCLRTWYSAVRLSGNRFDGCDHAFLPEKMSNIDAFAVDTTNTIDGGIMLHLRDLEDAIVDGADLPPIGWLRADAVDRVTLRNLQPRPAGDSVHLQGGDIVLEQSAFASPLVIRASNVTLRRVLADSGLIIQAETVHLEDVDARSPIPHPRAAATLSVTGDATVTGGSFRGGEWGMRIHLEESGDAEEGEARVRLSIRDVLFLRNEIGLIIDGEGDAVLRGSSFENVMNSRTLRIGFVALDRGESTTDARSNWWGDRSGPAADGNPEGRGDAIFGTGVSFAPWLASATR